MSKKQNKLILTIFGIIFLIAIGTIAVVNKSSNEKIDDSRYSAGLISVLENSFDFGTISMKDGKVSHRFEFKNEGSESLLINEVSTSCMCTTAFVYSNSKGKSGPFGMGGHGVSAKTNIKIDAEENFSVEVFFDPNAHGPLGVGLNQRAVYLGTNSQKTPKVELQIQANVVR